MISQTAPVWVSERWYSIPRLLKSLPSDDGYSHSSSLDEEASALIPLRDENGTDWMRHEYRQPLLLPKYRRQNDCRPGVDDEMLLDLEPYQHGRYLNIAVSNQRAIR